MNERTVPPVTVLNARCSASSDCCGGRSYQLSYLLWVRDQGDMARWNLDVAPIRAASCRCASGGDASSFWATRYQGRGTALVPQLKLGWSAAIGRATPGISLPDGRYIGADERCLLLVDHTFTAIGMTGLEVREGGC